MLRIGPYSLFCLDVQYFSLDGGSVFGVVPKVMWQDIIEPDALNRIRLSMRVLLISGNGRNILVDAAMGTAWNDKLRDIYQLSDFQLDDELQKQGVRSDEVTDIVFTHLHFDHLAGAFRRSGEDLVPLFPHARHIVQRHNFEAAMHPNLKERASYRKEYVDALARHPALVLVDGPGVLSEGVELICSEGHTAGQQLVMVRDGSNSLLHGGGLLPAVSHLGYARGLGFDVDPLAVISEKQQLIPALAADGTILFFAHDPFHEAGLIGLDEHSQPFLFSSITL